MEGEGYDPEELLWVFAGWGLIKGFVDAHAAIAARRSELQAEWEADLPVLRAALREQRMTRLQATQMRVLGLVTVLLMVIEQRGAGLAWASVLHFVLKYLGTYHGCRLLSWSEIGKAHV